MILAKQMRTRFIAATLLAGVLSACGGGDGETAVSGPDPSQGAQSDNLFATEQATSRFLVQSTFGPTPMQVSAQTGRSASAWFVGQLDKPATLHTPMIEEYLRLGNADIRSNRVARNGPAFAFWRASIESEDQMRQRMAFALSQILVVSDYADFFVGNVPEVMGGYRDTLVTNAFGNYRELLEDITYNPAMGYYLTYMGNRKEDPRRNRKPDENYARELLQLFTIGLVELNPDGTPVIGSDGKAKEIYDNADITGLARVFTGLDLEGLNRREGGVDRIGDRDTGLEKSFLRPMTVNTEEHSVVDKVFLGTTIAAGTSAQASIDQALDTIMAHKNVGPFVGRQLIQRFTTSNPSPAYTTRVASAFDAGRYTLPNGATVGDGRKGDLAATLAAVLFDEDARGDAGLSDPGFGKIREPILRFTGFARAFGMDLSRPEYNESLYDTSRSSSLSQHPYRSASVFNFYRPGYVPPNTQTGARDMTVPEMQLVNASSTTGYINFASYLAFNNPSDGNINRLRTRFEGYGVPFNEAQARATAVADYAEEIALAGDTAALVDHLDAKLLYSTMSAETRSGIISALGDLSIDAAADEAQARAMAQFAVTLVLTSPDFIVQR